MSMKRNWPFRAAVAVLMATTPLASSSAETLQEALASAYLTNPELTAQRAAQRAIDERVAQATSAMRPGLSTTTDFNQDFPEPGQFQDDGRQFQSNVTLSQPIFAGGRNRANVRGADQRVLSGRQTLRATENRVLLNTVTAYSDVLRDQSVVELNRNQVRVLEEQLRASRDRFEVGDLTRTDVAQSEARLATARANLTSALGQLALSREAYRRIVGRQPGTLEPLPPLPTLPGTIEQTVDIASAENPQLLAARFNEEAARSDVRVAQAARLPTLGAQANVGYNNAQLGSGNANQGFRINDFSQSVGARLTLPLYEGGAASSRIREAQARRSQAVEQIAIAEREAVENARNSWEQIQTARATIEAADVAVRANELALEGTRQENLVGSRNILDVLNAEQELLNARVSLVRARRDEYVAAYGLLASIGRAEAAALGLPVDRYDPAAYYREVRNRWGGTDVDLDQPGVTSRPN